MFRTLLIDGAAFPDTSPLSEPVSKYGEYNEIGFPLDEDGARMASEADAIVVVNRQRADAAFIDTLRNCRVLCRTGVGYDNIDAEYASKKGIYVANAPHYCDEPVSDHAVAMLLALERRLIMSSADMKASLRFSLAKIRGIRGLNGATAGIIGLGATGRLTAKKLTAFGMNILYYHPRRRTDETGDGYTAHWADLDELLMKSDYVILHATSTPETFHMIDARALSLMKPTAAIVNIARGELIDTPALNAALENKTIACAALDVFEGKLTSDMNKELIARDNVLVTPHSAWLTVESEELLLTRMAESICDVAEGRPPRYCVNLDSIVLPR